MVLASGSAKRPSIFLALILCTALYAHAGNDALRQDNLPKIETSNSKTATYGSIREAIETVQKTTDVVQIARIFSALPQIPVQNRNDFLLLYNFTKAREDNLPHFSRDADFNADLENTNRLALRLRQCSGPLYDSDIAILISNEVDALHRDKLSAVPGITTYVKVKQILRFERVTALIGAAKDSKNYLARPALWTAIEEDKDGQLGHYAADALAAMRNPEDLDRLLSLVKKEPSLQFSFAGFGSMVIPRVLKEINDPNEPPAVKARLAGTLREVSSHDNLEMYIPLLQHPNPDVAESALRSITKNLTSDDESVISDLMKSRSSFSRARVIVAIGERAWSNKYVPALIDALKKDADSDNRALAAHYLGNHKVRSALSALQDATRDPDPQVREDARYAIKQLAGEVK